MKKYVLNESSVHYAIGFLERYHDKYPTKKHEDVMKDIRALSDLLLEHLGQTVEVVITRHNLKK